MDLLAGYDSDASSDEEGAPVTNSNETLESASGSMKAKLNLPVSREETGSDKPGVRKVNLKALASLLPPPKAGSEVPSNLGKRDGDSDDEGQEPLWKRLRAQKPGSGLSLSALLPKPVHEAAPASRTGTLDTSIEPLGSVSGIPTSVAKRPPIAQAPGRDDAQPQHVEVKPGVSASSSAPPVTDPPKKFKMSFGGTVTAAPRPMEASPAVVRPSTFPLPSAAPSLARAAPSYGVHSAAAYEVGGVGISYEHIPGPSAPESVNGDGECDDVSAPGPSGLALPEAGLDRHMRKALASGGVAGMQTVSVAQLSGSWDPRTAEQQKKEKVCVCVSPSVHSLSVYHLLDICVSG
jgi:hypothetical protein